MCFFLSVKVVVRVNKQQGYNVRTRLHNGNTSRLCGCVFNRLTVNKRIKTSTFTSRASHKTAGFLSLHPRSFHVPAAPDNQADMHQNTLHLPTSVLLSAIFKFRKWRQSRELCFGRRVHQPQLLTLLTTFSFMRQNEQLWTEKNWFLVSVFFLDIFCLANFVD